MQEVPEVTIDDLARALASKDECVLVDVREDYEWEEAHHEAAMHVPLGALPDQIEQIPGGRRVFVICASGGRSLAGAAYLNEAGHDAVSVAGGMKGWIASGNPGVIASTANP